MRTSKIWSKDDSSEESLKDKKKKRLKRTLFKLNSFRKILLNNTKQLTQFWKSIVQPFCLFWLKLQRLNWQWLLGWHLLTLALPKGKQINLTVVLVSYLQWSVAFLWLVSSIKIILPDPLVCSASKEFAEDQRVWTESCCEMWVKRQFLKG